MRGFDLLMAGEREEIYIMSQLGTEAACHSYALDTIAVAQVSLKRKVHTLIKANLQLNESTEHLISRCEFDESH